MTSALQTEGLAHETLVDAFSKQSLSLRKLATFSESLPFDF